MVTFDPRFEEMTGWLCPVCSSPVLVDWNAREFVCPECDGEDPDCGPEEEEPGPPEPPWQPGEDCP